ncbi:hypothetical protein ACTWPT_08180 [Nonomuraea sp. 3N208]|uniref:hypothetical protein n=1 Tax=Nonomuraea sp. 3N208 TaxID=3457421 RepID=UPI003FCDD4DC
MQRCARCQGRQLLDQAVATHGDRVPLEGDRLFALLERAVPDVDAAELRIRMWMVVAMVTVLFATAPEPGEIGQLGTDDLDEQLARLVAFLAPGLAAPPAGHGGDDLTPRHRHIRPGGMHVSA